MVSDPVMRITEAELAPPAGAAPSGFSPLEQLRRADTQPKRAIARDRRTFRI
jgi:hypothetical protein